MVVTSSGSHLMNAEELYTRLGRLISAPPKIEATAATNDTRIWLAQAYALVVAGGDINDRLRFKNLITWLSKRYDSDYYREVFDVLYRTLAVAETDAPASAQGAFIPAGSAFDAMAAVGKVLGSAKARVRIVDPYMDEKALTDFAVLLAEGIATELLADSKNAWPSFRPAVQRFMQQYGVTRPLEARLAPHKALHDRLIIVDGATVWTLTQSLNAFAARSPATIVRIDGDAAPLKIAAYDSFWSTADAIA
jgi:hypothetical protein